MSNQTIHVGIDHNHGVGSLSKTTLKQASEIPIDVRQYMPDPSLLVPLLLTYSFPPVFNSKDQSLCLASDCITDLEALWNIGTLLMALIPHWEWVSDVGIQLRKQWGSREAILSVQYPVNSGL